MPRTRRARQPYTGGALDPFTNRSRHLVGDRVQPLWAVQGKGCLTISNLEETRSIRSGFAINSGGFRGGSCSSPRTTSEPVMFAEQYEEPRRHDQDEHRGRRDTHFSPDPG